MAGTKEGASKAKQKILARDPDFFKKIGSKGGKNGHTGGFASSKKLAMRAGRKGGLISKRGPIEETEYDRKIRLEAIEEMRKLYEDE